MGLTPEQHQAVDAYLAKHAGADAPLVKALLTDGELSTGDPAATSPKGARGLMQLMPIAVKDIGLDPDTFPYDNPAENLKGGIAYVKKLREDYGFTNPLQIAAAYNAGPSAVKAAIAKGGIQFLPAETQAYVKRMHAALGQRVNAPTESSVPAASAPQDTAPVMPAMTDAADPVDRTLLPTESVYTPPAGAVPGQAGAPIPVGTPGAAPPNLVTQIMGGVARAGLGAVELGRAAGRVMLPEAATPPLETAAAQAVEQVAPQPDPQTPAGYLDAAVQGATYGAVGGVPGAAIGAVSGVVSNAAANMAERMGYPRIIGGVAGGLAVGAGTAAVRGAVGLGKGIVKDVRQARAAIKELDDATAALEAARMTKVSALDEAQDAALAARDAATLEKHQAMIAAAQEKGRTIAGAESAVVRAAQAREAARQSVTSAVDDYLVKETSPVERAGMLQQITQDRKDTIHAFIGDKYDDFLQRADDTGALVPTNEIRAEAQEIIDDLVISGVPREQAVAQAKAIVATLGQPGISFTHAQTLRSSLGAYAFKAKGAAQTRFIRMQNEVDRAVAKALPDDVMREEFTKLRAYRRAEGVLFQNTFVKKLLADTEEGRLAAEAYTTRLLSGDWTPGKLTSLRTTLTAAGDQGRAVMKDALLRQAMSDTKGDLGALTRVLRSKDALGTMADELLSPAEMRQLTELSSTMKRATQEFEGAVAAVKPTKAAAQARFLERKASALETEAQALSGIRQTQLQRTRQQRNLVYAAALRKKQAKLAVPAGATHPNQSVLSVLGQVLWQHRAGVRMLLDPRQRATLLRAGKLSATSAQGAEMLRTLTATLARETGRASESVDSETPPAPATAATPAR